MRHCDGSEVAKLACGVFGQAMTDACKPLWSRQKVDRVWKMEKDVEVERARAFLLGNKTMLKIWSAAGGFDVKYINRLARMEITEWSERNGDYGEQHRVYNKLRIAKTRESTKEAVLSSTNKLLQKEE